MAKFEDPLQQNLDFTPDEVGEEPAKKEQIEAQEPEEQPAVEANPESILPDKYKGKTVEDLAKMHQEAEKLIGKHAQEVGEHRKFFDDMMKRELLQKKAQQPTQEDEDPNEKFFKKPTEAMDDYLSNHPTIKQAQEQALIMKAQTAQQQLQQQFPDYVQVIQTPEFKQWVDASPIRQKLYQEADGGYDIASATELISTWQAISGSKQSEQQTITTKSEETRSKSLKAASVDTGATGVSSKKRYSRLALQDLLKTNPDKYYANSDEILLAYEEGRIY
ncbi:MAG: hypothetical protein CMJ25_07800 [Phycisphaerae bacterium]|nr:hypothetical protein [Phycisphaerae bacterium]|tara:strand:- start:1477 stop:2304 length:828 start_codon:yes stop_codon:yes gene_type:complete